MNMDVCIYRIQKSHFGDKKKNISARKCVLCWLAKTCISFFKPVLLKIAINCEILKLTFVRISLHSNNCIIYLYLYV